ncbi:TonB-dependent receptor [Henriciella litoralis]|uniref:TonB-dependent receptor n=1 Tax=Henriciella litoralis TaxID=568102 RepID=UPI000A015FF6|nr:TonB-dependent receptor [Henriciella litoralis]
MAGATGAVHAQEADQDTEQSRTLETVTITATKREENLQDVPISISAFSEAQIEATGSQNLQDLANSIPNLVYPSSREGGGADISIRGVFQQAQPLQIGFDNGYGVYLDGVYMGKHFSVNQDLGEIERVEVLRGPQGTLFGKNTIAGALNIVSKRPDNEFGGQVSAEIGNYDLRRVRASVNVPIVEDKLAFRLALSGTERDGYVKNKTLGVDLANIDDFNGRLLVGYTPTPNTGVYLSVDHRHSVSRHYEAENADIGFTNYTGDDEPFTVYRDFVDRNDLQTFGTSLTVEHEFENGFSLTSITGYRDDKINAPRDVDGSDFGGYNRNKMVVGQNLFTQELRLASPEYDRFDYVAGLYYFKQANSRDEVAEVLPTWIPALVGFANFQYDVDVESYAAFFHSNFRVTDDFTLFGGLRYTDETKELEALQTSDPAAILPAFGVPFGQADIDEDIQDSDISYTAGLRYQFTDDIMAYGSVATGYKSGAFNVGGNITTGILANDLTVDPESVTSYEAGMKTRLFNGMVQLNGAVFLLNYDDLQVRVFDPTVGTIGTNVLKNAASVESKGFELELSARPTDPLLVALGIGYVDSTYDSFEGVPLQRPAGSFGDDNDGVIDRRTDATGNRVPLAPKWTINAAVGYDVPLPNQGQWRSRLDYNYKSERYGADGSTNDPADLLPGYSLINVRTGYESPDGNYGIYLWAKNLTDERELDETRYIQFITSRLQQRYIEPRTYGVSVNMKF